jgi:hypothetical protein
MPASLQSNWEHQQQARERRRQAWENLGALVTNLGAAATSLGAPRITAEQSGEHNIFFGNAAGARLEIIATTNRTTNIKTPLFSLYSHLCIYVSI